MGGSNITRFSIYTHLSADNERCSYFRLQDLSSIYTYQGEETCAADGMCQVKCPVKINTGELIKHIRHEQLGSPQTRAQKTAMVGFTCCGSQMRDFGNVGLRGGTSPAYVWRCLGSLSAGGLSDFAVACCILQLSSCSSRF